MLPFPREILDLRQNMQKPACVIEERPWWIWHEVGPRSTGYLVRAHRIDGVSVGPCRVGSNPIGPGVLLDLIAEQDAADPLPLPVVRAGQVWAFLNEGRVETRSVTARDAFGRAWFGTLLFERHLVESLKWFLVYDPFDPGLVWAPKGGEAT